MVSQRSQQLAPQQKRHLNTTNTAIDTTIRLHAQGLCFSWGERRALSNVSLDLKSPTAHREAETAKAHRG